MYTKYGKTAIFQPYLYLLLNFLVILLERQKVQKNGREAVLISR